MQKKAQLVHWTDESVFLETHGSAWRRDSTRTENFYRDDVMWESSESLRSDISLILYYVCNSQQQPIQKIEVN